MKSKAVGELSKIVLLVLGVLVAMGSAQKTSVCTSPPSPCTPKCGLNDKKQCVLQVIESTHLFPVAQVVILDDSGQPVGKPNDDVCVNEGTIVVFSEGMSDSSFVVSFGSSHPFVPCTLPGGSGGIPVFQGNNQAQSSATVAQNTTGVNQCFQYEINHCRRGHKCAHKDPKVIVKGGVFDDDAKKPKK
jgi:hypothetical protein